MPFHPRPILAPLQALKMKSFEHFTSNWSDFFPLLDNARASHMQTNEQVDLGQALVCNPCNIILHTSSSHWCWRTRMNSSIHSASPLRGDQRTSGSWRWNTVVGQKLVEFLRRHSTSTTRNTSNTSTTSTTGTPLAPPLAQGHGLWNSFQISIICKGCLIWGKTIAGHMVDLTTQSVAKADGTTVDHRELKECHNLE